MTSHPMKRWSDCSLFSNNLVDGLINTLDEDKVIMWKISDWLHWVDPSHLNNNARFSIIGGIFGGKKDPVIKYCDAITDRFIDMVVNKKTLYLDEVIMTIEENFNPDLYKKINFDVWYHEDSGDWCQTAIIGKKSFYRTFEELNNIHGN